MPIQLHRLRYSKRVIVVQIHPIALSDISTHPPQYWQTLPRFRYKICCWNCDKCSNPASLTCVHQLMSRWIKFPRAQSQRCSRARSVSPSHYPMLLDRYSVRDASDCAKMRTSSENPFLLFCRKMLKISNIVQRQRECNLVAYLAKPITY